MKIIIDAMGGDNAPFEIVKGSLIAHDELGAEIVLTGDGEAILRVLDELGYKELPAGVEIMNASEVITMEDDPATAFKRKPDSSMTVGLKLLRDGGADAMISAGSTGALLSGATLIVKRIKGIRRAALAPTIPNGDKGVLLIDCGANVECTPEYLLQFAYMGSFYAKKALGIENPRVGLLNVGTEETKGTPMHVEANRLLRDASESGRINFVGNVEAREVMFGACDVVVADGFSGNIMLKCIEGVAKYMGKGIKNALYSSLKSKIGGLLIKDKFNEFKKTLDASEVGGTALVGISKPVIKAHGSSDARAIRSAVRQAMAFVNAGITQEIQSNIDYMKLSDGEQGRI